MAKQRQIETVHGLIEELLWAKDLDRPVRAGFFLGGDQSIIEDRPCPIVEVHSYGPEVLIEIDFLPCLGQRVPRAERTIAVAQMLSQAESALRWVLNEGRNANINACLDAVLATVTSLRQTAQAEAIKTTSM